MIKVYVSSDASNLDLLEEKVGIVYPEHYKHPGQQVKWVEKMYNDGVRDMSFTTNSPYIIQAMRYYYRDEEVEYYDFTKDGLKDITDDLNVIFASMAGPLHEIMNVDSR